MSQQRLDSIIFHLKKFRTLNDEDVDFVVSKLEKVNETKEEKCNSEVNVSCKKLVAEQYFFPETKEHPWFLVTICGKSGTVDIQSDHGDYQHCWPSNAHQRKSLKHFLATGSPEYFQDKFGYPSSGRSGAGRVYDPKYQEECLIEKLKQKFEDDYVMTWEEFLIQAPSITNDEISDKDEFLKCLDVIKNKLDYSDPNSLIEENENNSLIINFLYGGDWSEIVYYTVDFHLKKFMETCWPVFQSELAKEINQGVAK